MNSKTRVVMALATVAAIGGASATIASAATVRHVGPTNVKPIASTTIAQIQGGSTGDPGSYSDAQCAQLGSKANDAANKGRQEVENGDIAAGQADGRAAQAIVDYGMDNGCFFWGLPW